ncbi:MAG: hypothetical protein A2010_14875 [Nitrospirae bacterium GWD2_57_9]|nr:MAG: hypothetical protein A2010_14875 [Nitrospirae bacterium GWD2_57_9]OGW47848.1 MAG: hypothetical protein A2078_15850 [Nitrospirae bacterium GWC2_57_9]
MKKNLPMLPVFRTFSVAAATALVLLLCVACGRDNSSIDDSSDPRNVNSGNTAVSLSKVQLIPCPATGTKDISMKNQTFDPDYVTVPVNTVVKWTNNGSGENWWVISGEVPENGAFHIPPFGLGKSECAKFTAPGTYNYHCNPEVKGVVIVK